jgi:hypothetical protein
LTTRRAGAMERLSQIFRKANPRERALVLGALLLVSLVATKFLVLDEAMLAYSLTVKKSDMEKEIARSRSMLRELAEAHPDSLRNSPLWPYRQENAGVGGLIRKVSATGEARPDFTVRKIAVEKTEKLPEFDKTKFEVEVEGPFQTIGAFLEELENSRFLTRVESVQVYRIEKELRLCRAKILVSSFSWREL